MAHAEKTVCTPSDVHLLKLNKLHSIGIHMKKCLEYLRKFNWNIRQKYSCQSSILHAKIVHFCACYNIYVHTFSLEYHKNVHLRACNNLPLVPWEDWRARFARDLQCAISIFQYFLEIFNAISIFARNFQCNFSMDLEI